MSDRLIRAMSRALIGAAFALSSQTVLGDAAGTAAREPEVVRVTAKRPLAVSAPRIEIDTAQILAALNRSLALDLARKLEAIGAERVELTIAEVPTRG